MSSSTESGILNCLDGFTKLVAMILSFGSSYNPTPARLKSENLQNSLNQAKTIVADVNSAYSANKNAIAARKAAFISLSKLFTRVVNAFTITDADANLKANVKSVAAKMHSSSKKSSASEADNGNSPDTGQSHSSAQTGYINKVGHLRRIIALMSAKRLWEPLTINRAIRRWRFTANITIPVGCNLPNGSFLVTSRRPSFAASLLVTS